MTRIRGASFSRNPPGTYPYARERGISLHREIGDNGDHLLLGEELQLRAIGKGRTDR